MITYPYTIENGHGERITFLGRKKEGDMEYLELGNYVSPGCGPPMHVHFKQNESLTVVQGRMAAQLKDGTIQYFGEGESNTFKSGEAHRFWNAGKVPLICQGRIWPVNNIEYFLTEVYRSIRENKGNRPATFDAAYLLHHFKTEFDMVDIPPFVKKVIFPVSLFFGKLSGKDARYRDAPEAVR